MYRNSTRYVIITFRTTTAVKSRWQKITRYKMTVYIDNLFLVFIRVVVFKHHLHLPSMTHNFILLYKCYKYHKYKHIIDIAILYNRWEVTILIFLLESVLTCSYVFQNWHWMTWTKYIKNSMKSKFNGKL